MFVLVADVLIPQPNDDAFIFLRYADNVASGLGPVFNPGERVEGFSSPLWLAILALARVVTRSSIDGMKVAQAASMACALATYAGMLALLRQARVRFAALPFAALVFVLTPLSFVWGRSGMDTMLAAALLVWLPLVLERARRDPRRATTALAAVMLGLVVLSRPEGPAWAATALAASWWFARKNDGASADSLRVRPLAIVIVAVTLAMVLARLAYFGAFVANTASAKMSAGPDFWKRGLVYVGEFLLSTSPLALPLGILAAKRREDALGRSVLALYVIALLIVVAESGDFLWFFRLCAPAWPLGIVLMTLGLDRLFARGLAGKIAAAAGAIFVVYTQGLASFDGDLAIRASGLDESLRGETALGKTMSEVLLPGESIAIAPLGRFVYYARPTRAWDSWGLVVPEIAKSARVPGKVGHERRAGSALLARHPTFVIYRLKWEPGPPCANVDPEGHGQGLGDQFAAFEHDPDYVMAYIEDPRKPRFYGVLVRADALDQARTRKLHLAKSACGS